MKIEKVICSKGRTGFYFDDQKAIKAGAKNDGAAYIGEPMTPGFTSIRMAGEAISVQLVLSDGQIALGDHLVAKVKDGKLAFEKEGQAEAAGEKTE